MHLSLGFVSLAVVISCSACSSNSSTSGAGAKGNVTVAFDNCNYVDAVIAGSGGPPSLTDPGATVSNGKNYKVSCQLTPSGDSYSLDAQLESTNVMSLSVQSSNVSVGATMSFYIAGTGGTPDSITSTDDKNNAAPTCTLVTSGSDTLLTVGSGTIFAEYDCPKVVAASNVGTICRARGLFQFTGCSD
jgi:hypothetical protein